MSTTTLSSSNGTMAARVRIDDVDGAPIERFVEMRVWHLDKGIRGRLVVDVEFPTTLEPDQSGLVGFTLLGGRSRYLRALPARLRRSRRRRRLVGTRDYFVDARVSHRAGVLRVRLEIRARGRGRRHFPRLFRAA